MTRENARPKQTSATSVRRRVPALPLIVHDCDPEPISALLQRAWHLALENRWGFHPAAVHRHRRENVTVELTQFIVNVTNHKDSMCVTLRRAPSDGRSGRWLPKMLASWSNSAARGIASDDPAARSMMSKAADASATLAAAFAATEGDVARVHILGTGDVYEGRVRIYRPSSNLVARAPAEIAEWVDTGVPRYRSLRVAYGGHIADVATGESTKLDGLDPISIMRLTASLPDDVFDAVRRMSIVTRW